MTLTMYRAMSGNPIWWKNDVLYAVTMDFWDPQQPNWDKKPELPPEQLTYRDAMAVYRSDIPKHKVIMPTRTRDSRPPTRSATSRSEPTNGHRPRPARWC